MGIYKSNKKLPKNGQSKLLFSVVVLFVLTIVLVFLIKNIKTIQDFRSKAAQDYSTKGYIHPIAPKPDSRIPQKPVTPIAAKPIFIPTTVPTPTIVPTSVPTPRPTVIPTQGTKIINHTSTNINSIPKSAIDQAKSRLHIAYGHTSHGSQLITGMTGLVGFKGSTYAFRSGGGSGYLDLNDNPFSGADDLGAPNFTAWASVTRNYLNSHPNINVVIWSWCGEVSGASAANIDTYLNLMSSLERDFPNVTFVYMTGHTDGTGTNGNLNIRNEQIRKYCRDNNKFLYDFADIESYNPDGTEFLSRGVNDACDYNSGNWATQWQNSHTVNIDWYQCESAHSQPLNANLKAYAAWWLWAKLAGW